MPINPAVGAAMVSAGGQMGAGLMNILSLGSNAHYQRKNMRYQKDLNLELMGQQYAYNKALYEQQIADEERLWEKQFNMQNEWNEWYNDPKQQRFRLENAGYNPYALLGQSGLSGSAQSSSNALHAPSASGVGSQSVGLPQAPQMNFDFIGRAVDSYFDTMMKSQMIREQSAKANIMESDATYANQMNLEKLNNLRSNTRHQLSSANLSEKERDILLTREKLLDGTIAALQEKPFLENEQIRKQNLLIDEKTKFQTAQTITEQLQQKAIQMNIKVSQRSLEKMGAEIAHLFADIDYIRANKNLTDAQRKEVEQRTINAFWSGLREQNWYQREWSTNDLYIRQLQSGIDLTLERTRDLEDQQSWREFNSLSGAFSGALGLGLNFGLRGSSNSGLNYRSRHNSSGSSVSHDYYGNPSYSGYGY